MEILEKKETMSEENRLDELLKKIDPEQPAYMIDVNGFSVCKEIRELKSVIIELIGILKTHVE